MKFEDTATLAREIEDQCLLADYPIEDASTYYAGSIERALNDWLAWEDENFSFDRRWSQSEREKLHQLIIDWAGDLLTINYGMWSSRGFVAIASSEEVEIDLTHLHWTDKRREIVNRYSYIYVDSAGYGYVTHDAHLDIDLAKLFDLFVDDCVDTLFEEN